MTAVNHGANNLPSRKRFSKRLWFGVVAALVLVTLPVLPLNPFAAFDPNRLSVEVIKDMIGEALRKPFSANLGAEREAMVSSIKMSCSASSEGVRSLSQAAGQLNQELRRFPDDPSRLTAWAAGSLARAQALLQVGRAAEAIQEYQNLIKREPRIALAHQQLGLLFIEQHDLASAIPELEAATRLDPQDASACNNLGLAYLERGDRQLANTEFSRACSLDPKNILAAINLANLLSDKGQYDQAIQTLRTSLVLNPHSANGHNNLGSLLSLTGKTRQAIMEFQTALSLNPNMSTAHYGLGLALFNMQSYQPAIGEFKAALALNPALVDAQNKLEQAYRRNELAVSSASGIN